jgi:hypothetical protein
MARAFIREHKPDFERKQKELDKYKMAKVHVQKIFPMMSARHAGKATKVFEKQESFTMILAPLAEFILIKDLQLAEEDIKNKEALALMKELRECKDSSLVLDLLDKVELLTCETPLLAFKNDPDQRRKWFATTYSDEWCGVMGGWFRSYYGCFNGCDWNGEQPVMTKGCCGTLIPSKLWNTKFEDPLAESQRWYCWCTKRHSASWGQVVEIMTLSGKLLYCWATVPPDTIQDIRALKIERELGKQATAEEIYDSLPVIPPQQTEGCIQVHPLAPRCRPGEERFFTMEEDFFNKLPKFEWYQIFNMTGAPMMDMKKTGAKARRALEWEIDGKKKQVMARMTERANARAKASGASSSSAK